MEPLRLLDLFSGIGGFSLGLERTGGFKTAAFCEINAKCRHLLNHHWPKVPAYNDVLALTAERLGADGISVDAVCGGFPCQDLSYAGKGAGLAGERSGLWFQIARLLRELRDCGRPVRFVILENVAALLGRGLGVVLGDLAALGYDAEWDCIRAADVGAPHLRDRIWIIAYSRGVEHESFGDAFRRALAAGLSEAYLANTDCGLHPGGLGCGEAGGATGRSESGDQGEGQAPHGQWVRTELGAGGAAVADSNVIRLERLGSDADPQGRQGPELGPAGLRDGTGHRSGWWATEPDVGRVAHGVPARVDRLHGLGNAVIPQIPEVIGRAILASMQTSEAA